MKKILLTGSNGFVASRFYEFYKQKYDFVFLNRNSLDMTNENEVFGLFKNQKFDFVFHVAAMADIGECEKNQTLAYNTNVKSTINIAKGCALKNSVLVYASSDQVYSGTEKKGPFDENTNVVAKNFYAQTKIDAEKEISNIIEKYYSLRLTWMFSLPERNKKINGGIILNIINDLMKNNEILLNNNDYRGLTYVYEVIENFENIINAPFGIYNFGSENNISVYEIGKVILEKLGLKNRIGEILKESNGTYRDLRISNKKLKNQNINFLDSKEAIEKCLNDFGF